MHITDAKKIILPRTTMPRATIEIKARVSTVKVTELTAGAGLENKRKQRQEQAQEVKSSGGGSNNRGGGGLRRATPHINTQHKWQQRSKVTFWRAPLPHTPAPSLVRPALVTLHHIPSYSLAHCPPLTPRTAICRPYSKGSEWPAPGLICWQGHPKSVLCFLAHKLK